MAKQKRQPVKWHVYELGGYYHTLSDTDLVKMDDRLDRERIRFTFVGRKYAERSAILTRE